MLLDVTTPSLNFGRSSPANSRIAGGIPIFIIRSRNMSFLRGYSAARISMSRGSRDREHRKAEHRPVRDADAMIAVRLPIQIDPEWGQDFPPALEMYRFTVNHDSVEVEEHRFVLRHQEPKRTERSICS